MSTALAAIQTNYAGCRFRSRLEARWAVFFDNLNIPWEYEVQGYTVGDGRRYLPDFWLPNPGLWVEVKGPLDHEGLVTLLYAASAAGLPTSPTREAPLHRVGPWEKRILILGSVPDPRRSWLHTRLDLVGDFVVASPVTIVKMPRAARLLGLISHQCPTVLNPVLAGDQMDEESMRRLVDGFAAPMLNPVYAPSEAFAAARSARFEYGETPTPPSEGTKP